MDIRAKTVLDLVKSVNGAEHAVIAGGAVRDMLHNVPNKDVDIIIPVKSLPSVKKEVMKLNQELMNKSEEYVSNKKSSRYSLNTTSSSAPYREGPIRELKFEVYGFEFEGVKFDLITSSHPNDEDFGVNVINDFDYGMNMVFYDGLFVNDENGEFQSDKRNGYMTLRKIDSLSDLPKMIGRYNSISERWYQALHWRPTFRCTALTIKRPSKKKVVEDKMNIYDIIAQDVEDVDIPAIRPRQMDRDNRRIGGIAVGAAAVDEMVQPLQWEANAPPPQREDRVQLIVDQERDRIMRLQRDQQVAFAQALDNMQFARDAVNVPNEIEPDVDDNF